MSETLYKFSIERYNVVINQPYNEIPTPKKNRGFYTVDRIYDDSVDDLLRCQFTIESKEETEEAFIKHFGNPLATVEVNRNTMVIERTGPKISIKYYSYLKYRRAGFKYFKRKKSMKYLTYNTDTNCFFKGQTIGHEGSKKNTSSVKKNFFLESPIRLFLSAIPDFEILLSKDSYVVKHAVSTGGIFIKDFFIETFLKLIPGFRFSHLHSKDHDMYKLYLINKGVKYPNNWFAFKNVVPMPRKHIWKRNGFKLIDTVMDVNKLNGDKMKNILHKITIFNPKVIKYYDDFFGKDFMRQQDVEDCALLYNFNIYEHHSVPNLELCQFSPKEKKNIYKLLVSSLREGEGQRILSSFYDHTRFYNKIKGFEPIKWKSSNMDEYQSEHMVWSNKYSYYTDGIYERIYDQSLIECIHQPIVDEVENTYIPVILCTTSDYNQESAHQQNCVRTYIQRPSSFIVSLRTNDEKDRATIEYRMSKEDDKIRFIRVQTLGRFNQTLSKEWSDAIQILDHRINGYLVNVKNLTFKLNTLIANSVRKTEVCTVDKKTGQYIWDGREDEMLINFYL
jgi:hypothetical protein